MSDKPSSVSFKPRIYGLMLIASLLSACAGTIPGVSQQGVAGITDVKVEWCAPASAESPKYLCGVSWIDGKEKANISLSVTLSDGTSLEYTADGVEAFKAHEVRAAVEEAISEDVREVVPNIADIIVDASAPL